MSIQIDLRDRSPDDHRRVLFEAFDDAQTGEDFEILADRDVDPDLLAYQVERERSLSWTHATPDDEPRELTGTVGGPLEDAELPSIDVRDLKPQRRHEALLDIFDALEADAGFVLINDHDPKPLYHELKSMHGDVIGWEYDNRGDGEWRVEIRKTAASTADDGDDVVTRYDVREIPKPERHPTIHHRYGMIPEGGTMELIAPHEPRPLKGEFHEQYGDSFEWEVVESEPGRCRVRITKGATADSGGNDEPESDRSAATGAAPAADEEIEVVKELDVRDRPPAQRHELIYEAYDELDGGSGFVLVNDHDPKPLYHQFEAEAGPAFRWEYRQSEPGEFRVLIAKAHDTERVVATSQQAGDGTTDAPF